MSYRDWDGTYFPPSRPKEARGGIKAQSRRGTFGESWWAARWISVLEGFSIGARLRRGRAYARSGQALSIGIEKGIVRAKVQGSRPRPYDVEIRVLPLSDGKWEKVLRALSDQALYAAKLLAGEMPRDIEEIFSRAGSSLFPKTSSDLKTDCSCPDWSNPCKHIAAVYYLLGEEFDRDPFLVFKLRGRSREELVGSLGSPRAADVAAPQAERGEAALPAEPLPSDPSTFWRMQPLSEDFYGEVRVPQVHASLPRQSGSFPFWRGAERFLDVMERIFARASSGALDVFLGK